MVSPNSPAQSIRRGFTLVEVMAVVVILGIIAGGTAYSLGPHVRMVRLNAALDRIEVYDRNIRRLARRKRQTLELTLSTSANRLTVRNRGREIDLPPLVVGHGFQMDRIRSVTQAKRFGDITVAIGSSGQSDSYAMRLTTPDDRLVWCVVLGSTGQMIRLSNEGDVHALFAQP